MGKNRYLFPKGPNPSKKKYETYVKASGTMNIGDLISYMKPPVLRSVLNAQIQAIEGKEELETERKKVGTFKDQKFLEDVWDTKVHVTGRYCADYGTAFSWQNLKDLKQQQSCVTMEQLRSKGEDVKK